MFGKWTFPKGKPNPGEALPDTAIRECGEEVGLFGLRNPVPLGRTSFRFRRQGAVVQKTVHFFLLEASPEAKEHFKSREEVPVGREHITEGKWVRTQTVFSVSSYKNSDRILARALRIMASQIRRPQRPAPMTSRLVQSPRPLQPPRPAPPPRPLPPTPRPTII